jgi:hypothetical protein
MNESNIQIEWFCSARAKTILDLENSNLASVRLRTAVGMKAAESLGFSNILSDGQFHKPVPLAVVGKIDYISDPQRPYKWLKRLEKLKRNGSKIVVDYTDHHMDGNSPASQFYRESIPLSDHVVTSSSKLKSHILAFYEKQVQIIEDPIEVPIQAPIIRDRRDKTALWFGHASNFPSVIDYLINKLDSRIIKKLIIMTNLYPLPDEYCQLLDTTTPKDLEINIIPWNKDDLVEVAKICDICLIPTDPTNPKKNGASSNRLLTSIALGLPTAVNFIDSYLPFYKYVYDIDATDLSSIFSDANQLTSKIREGQIAITDRYTRECVQQNWESLMSSLSVC